MYMPSTTFESAIVENYTYCFLKINDVDKVEDRLSNADDKYGWHRIHIVSGRVMWLPVSPDPPVLLSASS